MKNTVTTMVLTLVLVALPLLSGCGREEVTTSPTLVAPSPTEVTALPTAIPAGPAVEVDQEINLIESLSIEDPPLQANFSYGLSEVTGFPSMIYIEFHDEGAGKQLDIWTYFDGVYLIVEIYDYDGGSSFVIVLTDLAEEFITDPEQYLEEHLSISEDGGGFDAGILIPFGSLEFSSDQAHAMIRFPFQDTDRVEEVISLTEALRASTIHPLMEQLIHLSQRSPSATPLTPVALIYFGIADLPIESLQAQDLPVLSVFEWMVAVDAIELMRDLVTVNSIFGSSGVMFGFGDHGRPGEGTGIGPWPGRLPPDDGWDAEAERRARDIIYFKTLDLVKLMQCTEERLDCTCVKTGHEIVDGGTEWHSRWLDSPEWELKGRVGPLPDWLFTWAAGLDWERYERTGEAQFVKVKVTILRITINCEGEGCRQKGEQTHEIKYYEKLREETRTVTETHVGRSHDYSQHGGEWLPGIPGDRSSAPEIPADLLSDP